MKVFTDDLDVVFQGDVAIVRVSEIPADAVIREDKIAAHSETSHNHQFDATAPVWLYSTPDQMIQYLDVKETSVLHHLREHDTHESWEFPPGTYKIIRQRERSPEGWRKTLD